MSARELRAWALPGLLIMTALLAGCTGLGDECSFSQGMMESGQGQEGACNETDSFAYGTQGQIMSDTKTFTWENTEGQADVKWGFQGQGSVTLTIQDANGDQVFRRSIGGMGQSGQSASTDSGDPGDWTIRLTFSNFQGQMGVGIQAT